MSIAPRQFRFNIAFHILILAAAAALICILPNFLTRWSRAGAYSMQMDAEEGYVLNQALTMAQGGSIYMPVQGAPWLVGTYPPLFPKILSWCIGAQPDERNLETGRMLVRVMLGACLALIASIVLWQTQRPAIAILAPLLFLMSYEAFQWSAFVRIDFMALAFTLSGLAIFLSSRRLSWLAVAGLFFVAAAFTRQTAVLAPLACAATLALRDRRGLVWFAAPALAISAALFAYLQISTHGEFWRHVVTYNANRMDWTAWRMLMRNEIWFFHWLIIIAALLLAAADARARLRRRGGGSDTVDASQKSSAARQVIGPYAFLSALSLVGYAKAGAAPNYVLEPLAAAALWIGVKLGQFVPMNSPSSPRLLPLLTYVPYHFVSDDSPRTGSRVSAAWRQWAMPLIVAALLLAHGLYCNLHRLRIGPGPADTIPFLCASSSPPAAGLWESDAFKLVGRLRSARGAGVGARPIYCEEPIYTLLAGGDVEWQPFIMTELAIQHRASDAPMIERLRAHYYAAFVTCEDLRDPESEQSDHERYTRGVVAALRANYAVTAIDAQQFVDPPSLKTFYFWTAKP